MNNSLVGGTLNAENKITSLEVLEQINFFREQERGKNPLRHDTLLNVIRDEFEEEISLQKLLESSYISERGKTYPMFELTLEQAKQVLVRESKFVRRAVIAYIAKLESKLTPQALALPKFVSELIMDVERKTRELEDAKSKLSKGVAKYAENLGKSNLGQLVPSHKTLKPYPICNEGELPLGVQISGSKYRVLMRNSEGLPEHFGVFNSVEEAQLVAERVYYSRQTE